MARPGKDEQFARRVAGAFAIVEQQVARAAFGEVVSDVEDRCASIVRRLMVVSEGGSGGGGGPRSFAVLRMAVEAETSSSPSAMKSPAAEPSGVLDAGPGGHAAGQALGEVVAVELLRMPQVSEAGGADEQQKGLGGG